MRTLKLIASIVFPILIWAVVAVVGGLQGWWLTPVAQVGDVDSFSRWSQQQLASSNRGSAALALIQNGQLQSQYFAFSQQKIDGNTLFATASMSKLLTAIAVLHLANEDKIDLSQPVNRYLKRWQIPTTEFDANSVTIAHLLSHTSGLTDGLGFGDYLADEVLPPLTESLNNPRSSSGTKAIVVGLTPGAEWKYSGGGYLILQLLIEDVTGMDFEHWIQQTIFAPLSMSRSNYQYLALDKNQAGSYDDQGNAADIYQYAAAAATGLNSSLNDLTKLAIALSATDLNPTNATAVNPQLAAQLRHPAGAVFGSYIWGTGAMLYAPIPKDDYIFGHDGSNDPAINSSLRINPATGDAIIVLVTGNSSLASRIGFEWTLWQSGKPDFIMVDRVIDSALLPMVIGSILWLVGLFIYRRGRK